MSGIMLGTFTGKVYHPVTDGLVLQYSMSDYSGSGTSLPDSSGNSRTGTLSGSPTYGTTYFTLDGVNDYFITPDLKTPLSSETHSTECWLYPTSNGVVTSYLGQASINTAYHHSAIEIVSGNLEFGLWNAGLQSTGPTSAMSNNAWHQVVLTYDGTTCRGYLDGSLAGSVTVSWDSPYDGGVSEATAFHIAYGATDATDQGDGTYYNGRMGLQRIYNRALSAEEIVNNFNATRLYYTS